MAETVDWKKLKTFADEQIDPLLRAVLKSVYNSFIYTPRTQKLEDMLVLLKASKTDDEN